MTICVSCESDIEEDEEERTAACGHVFHEFCLTPMQEAGLRCPVCFPVPADEYIAVAEPEAEPEPEPEPEPVLAPVGGPEPLAEALPDPGPVPVAVASEHEAVEAEAEEPAADLDALRDAAALRLRTAIDRAVAAHQAASLAIGRLSGAGVAEDLVRSSVETAHAGFIQGLQTCSGTAAWEPYAVGMPTWPATAEMNGEADEASASYEGYAAVLEAAQPLLNGMVAVDVGEGVSDTLSATGETNVADLALGGAGYTGHNLHALSRDLKGWSSIRAEEGFVVIVRWNATKWQVGATGKHITTSSGDDYKLDAGVTTTFVTGLAWRSATGALCLA